MTRSIDRGRSEHWDAQGPYASEVKEVSPEGIEPSTNRLRVGRAASVDVQQFIFFGDLHGGTAGNWKVVPSTSETALHPPRLVAA